MCIELPVTATLSSVVGVSSVCILFFPCKATYFWRERHIPQVMFLCGSFFFLRNLHCQLSATSLYGGTVEDTVPCWRVVNSNSNLDRVVRAASTVFHRRQGVFLEFKNHKYILCPLFYPGACVVPSALPSLSLFHKIVLPKLNFYKIVFGKSIIYNL